MRTALVCTALIGLAVVTLSLPVTVEPAAAMVPAIRTRRTGRRHSRLQLLHTGAVPGVDRWRRRRLLLQSGDRLGPDRRQALRAAAAQGPRPRLLSGDRNWLTSP